MSRPAPTWKDHDKFCRAEGWRPVRDARGRSGTHHVTYELELPDGGVLCTRISHPPNRKTYGPKMWQHVLRDQLAVDEATFWACVRQGTAPDRGAPQPPPHTLPAELVHLLLTRVGIEESEVTGMTRAEAVDRLSRHWAEGG